MASNLVMPKSSEKTETQTTAAEVEAGALPPETLQQPFPRIGLLVRPPFAPMEAKLVGEIPGGGGWLYEPKWDGFRCLVFRKGEQVLMQSKAGQPLGRYFPELVEALRKLPVEKFVLDGEIIILEGGRLAFDSLLQRIHPAESRIRKLAKETPSTFLAFDLLVDEKGESLLKLSLAERRAALEKFFKLLPKSRQVRLSPASRERSEAEAWMRRGATAGLEGVIAKDLQMEYATGERTGMQKIKRIRTADCVVGGFRYGKSGEIGSLLLGLYNRAGKLDHVGFSSSFTAKARPKLKKILEPLMGTPGFTGKAPGGISRWSPVEREWHALKPKLVCEVQYDHFSGDRFRHGTKFLRWRPDKAPEQCTFEQVAPVRSRGMLAEFGLAA